MERRSWHIRRELARETPYSSQWVQAHYEFDLPRQSDKPSPPLQGSILRPSRSRACTKWEPEIITYTITLTFYFQLNIGTINCSDI
jgi:hypothetical protein